MYVRSSIGSFVVCAILIFSLSAFAQSDAVIRGTITARADGSLLPSSTVELSGPHLASPLRTTSSDDGHFSFPQVLPGKYTLLAARAGFQEQKLELTLKPREIRMVTLELAIQGIAQSIEVRNGGELLPTYSPGSTLLQGEFVDDLPETQKNNLTDMIAVVAPGMIRSHDDFVHIRGNEIALNTFINGVSFWENPHSVLSAGLTPNVIESANVMTGGFPAEYGNRFGGVVDIVTKSGLSMNPEGSVNFGVGSALRHNVAVEYGGHTPRFGFYFHAAGFESARYLSPNDPRSIHDTGRGAHNFLQFDFSPDQQNSLKLVLMGDGTNFQIPKTSLDDTLRPNLGNFQRNRGQTAILSWSHTRSRNTFLTTSLYERWSQARLLPSNEPLASFATNDRSLFTGGLKSDLTHFAGRHILKTGVDLVLLRPDEKLFFYGEGYVAFSHVAGLHHVHLRGPNRGPITFDGRKTGGQASGYVQDTLQLGRNLTLDAGIRFDGYSLATSTTHWSPRVNLAYRLPQTGTVFHASYNHFFVPPAIENVLISSGGLTRFLQDHPVELPPVQPVVEDQVELGVSHSFGRALRAGLTGYYRRSENPVHTVLFPDSRIYTYANFDKGKAYGMETRITVPVIEDLGLSAYLNYSLSRVYLWNPVLAGFVDESHHLEDAGRFLAPMDQTHTLNSGFTYRHRRSGFRAGMTFEYGSGTPTGSHDEATTSTIPTRVPGHFTQNLMVGFDVLGAGERPRLSFQFNVENLTNNVYKVSQESEFSPGEYFNPRFYSGSVKLNF